MDIIAHETGGKSYKTYKYICEGSEILSFDYDDHQEITWEKYGETLPPDKAISMLRKADLCRNGKPLFTYFLDGSRHTYKVDDIAYKNKVYPVIAGIPIRPVRIAFDHWELHDVYERAVRTAVEAGHTSLSNYVLYNYKDKPVELYRRLKLNVDLCEELNISIYSFPMKYHPIEDPDYFSNRDYIGENWNRKFIRTIQAVLNSTKGKVGKGYSFFCKAFGSDEEEFMKLLYMPEAMIIYRFYFEGIGLTDEWWNSFQNLTEAQLAIAKPIIESNDFSVYENRTDDLEILNVLSYYRIRREDAERAMGKNE